MGVFVIYLCNLFTLQLLLNSVLFHINYKIHKDDIAMLIANSYCNVSSVF
jgi:hypothetical protein